MRLDRKCKESHPVCSAEVNSFSKVISLIEATVVGSGEGDDELSSTLVGTYNLPIKHRAQSKKAPQQTVILLCACVFVRD